MPEVRDTRGLNGPVPAPELRSVHGRVSGSSLRCQSGIPISATVTAGVTVPETASIDSGSAGGRGPSADIPPPPLPDVVGPVRVADGEDGTVKSPPLADRPNSPRLRPSDNVAPSRVLVAVPKDPVGSRSLLYVRTITVRPRVVSARVCDAAARSEDTKLVRLVCCELGSPTPGTPRTIDFYLLLTGPSTTAGIGYFQ